MHFNTKLTVILGAVADGYPPWRTRLGRSFVLIGQFVFGIDSNEFSLYCGVKSRLPEI